MIPYLVCYFTVASIGIGVSTIELLSRYGAGNRPAWVLWGAPQRLYYLINALAGIIVLFVSEALKKTTIIESYAQSPSLAVVHTALLGVGAMFALRSSLYSIEKPNGRSKVDLGPAQILNVLNRYLDRQIDKGRGKNALEEVNRIMEGLDPSMIHPDLSAICLSVPEGIPKEDIAFLKKELDIVLKAAPRTAPYATAIVMGMLIQKEVGIETLDSAVKILKSQTKTGQARVSSNATLASSSGIANQDVSASDMIKSENSLDEKLAEKWQQLRDNPSKNSPKEGK